VIRNDSSLKRLPNLSPAVLSTFFRVTHETRKRTRVAEGERNHGATTSNDSASDLPHAGSLRLCISGCVCSTKRLSSPSSSHLNATSDPTNGRSARNAPAHPSGRSSALLLHPFGPRIGRFSYHLFISSRFIPPSWLVAVERLGWSVRSDAIGERRFLRSEENRRLGTGQPSFRSTRAFGRARICPIRTIRTS